MMNKHYIGKMKKSWKDTKRSNLIEYKYNEKGLFDTNLKYYIKNNKKILVVLDLEFQLQRQKLDFLQNQNMKCQTIYTI